MSYVKMPLYNIYVHSDLVSGDVTAGIRPVLPVKGIDFIIGNDLAGGN